MVLVNFSTTSDGGRDMIREVEETEITGPAIFHESNNTSQREAVSRST